MKIRRELIELFYQELDRTLPAGVSEVEEIQRKIFELVPGSLHDELRSLLLDLEFAWGRGQCRTVEAAFLVGAGAVLNPLAIIFEEDPRG